MKKTAESKRFERCKIIIILFIIFILGIILNSYQWTYEPHVRLIGHAAAAIDIALLLSYVISYWIEFIQEVLGFWFCVITFLNPRKKITKKLRLISKYCLSVIKPFTGTIIYILYAYYWEKYQADFYNREIQALQIKTDIIFAVLAAVLFINFEGERIFYQYRISIRECLFLARIFIQECEEEYKQKLLVLFFFLMPVWVTIFSVIGGVLFKLVFWN